MSLFKDKVWLSLNTKGRKINHEAQLEQIKLLIELNAQEISIYTNYFIAFFTIAVTALIFLYSLKPSIEAQVIFIIIIIACVIFLSDKITKIYQNNEMLVEAYSNIQAKRSGYRLVLIEGDVNQIKQMLKLSLDNFKGKIKPSAETLKMLNSKEQSSS